MIHPPAHVDLERYSSEQWNLLVDEFPEDERLKDIAVFAVPKELASEIGRLLPDVLSEHDVRFEHRLRELSATGFYFRTPMFSQVMDGLEVDFGELLEASVPRGKRDGAKRIELPLWWDSQDLTTEALSAEAKLRKESRHHVHRRLKGYAGWLVISPRFRVDLHQMLERHGPIVERCEAFIATRVEDTKPFLVGEPFAYRGSKQSLAERWMLDEMTANLIPEPVQPGYWAEDAVATPGSEAKGATVFIPWPLLADKDLKLSDILQGQKARRNMDHIQQWIDGDKEWGYDRLGRLLDLYVYCELAIRRRYGSRLKNRQAKLDEAFAAYWNPDHKKDAFLKVDSVSKLRQKLKRGLEESTREIELAATSPPRRIGATKFDPEPDPGSL